MIRPSVFAWVALAGAVGVGLFQLKQAVQTMDEELLRLNRQIVAEQQSMHVLRAEWSRRNHPQHLESLSRIALDLEPMKPGQMSRLGDIPFRPAAPAKVQEQQPVRDWQRVQAELASVEARLRSIPKDAPEGWMRDLRRQAFERAAAAHPGNPSSAAYDEQFVTENDRQSYLALRRECAGAAV